eukprot:gnl/MRDRNA2_/MRDRNA2_102345_c0_seq1.p1 gnl/MRDRNA2_/MRDRNA2_102345_c0~~gnl/MRDRNA2_/MRDRNA2_102345_c0_seq1.p1  ORF type:complete len:502 (+),score=97.84 gnl/MRDRNA2_/MRDRNA2_102345_c0_seq1:88-1593(+)
MAAGLLQLGRGAKNAWDKEQSLDRRDTSQTIDGLLAEISSKKQVQKKEDHWLLNSKQFQGVVYTLIMLNSIQMGLAVDYYYEEDLWGAFEHFFTLAFLIEMMVKLHFLRRSYFSDGWNRLDCFLVTMSVLDNWMIKPAIGDGSALSQLSVLRVLRVLRVARMARLLKVFKELWIILKGILESLRVMFWVTVLLLLTLYVCSILCVDLLGRKENGFDGFDEDQESIDATLQIAGWNNFQHFGTMSRSMYTLFNICILAEFTEIGRPTLERNPAMLFFFVCFIVFTTFGVLNVIIGVIVDNTMEAAKSMEQDLETQERNEKLKLLLRIRDMVFALDKDESGSISIEEVEEGWEDPNFQELLGDIDLPKGWTAAELMCLLDADGDGELTFDEFMRSFYRLIASNSFQMNCCMHAALNEVKRGVLSIEDGLGQVKAKQEEDTRSIMVQLKSISDRLTSIEANGNVNRGRNDINTPFKKPPMNGTASLGKMILPGVPRSGNLLLDE